MRIENLYEYADKLVARGYIEESDRLVEALNKITAKVEKGEDVKEELYKLYDFSDFFIEKGYEEKGENMVKDIKECIENVANRPVGMYAVIKMSVEESIKNSETIVWAFSSLKDAKRVWEEEVASMREDVANFPGSSFHENKKSFEALFDYENISTIVEIRYLEDGKMTIVNF